MVLCFILAGVAVIVAKERDYGARKMKEREIHSRRTIIFLGASAAFPVPRSNGVAHPMVAASWTDRLSLTKNLGVCLLEKERHRGGNGHSSRP
jgi:hypothetical protein